MPRGYTSIFYSDLNDASVCLNKLLVFIEAEFPEADAEMLFELRLIFSELFYNAVIHGNNMDRTKRVFLELEAGETSIRAIVRDEGLGFDYGRLLRDLDNCNLSESGRGIQLVQALCEDLSFNETGNEIKLLKRVVKNNA